MKKLLVMAVLMIVAAPVFAQVTQSSDTDLGYNTLQSQMGKFSYGFSGFLGRRTDLQDCRTVIQGDVSPLEMAKLMAVTKNPIDPTSKAFENLFK